MSTTDPELDWFRNVYRGDVPQFTLRSFVVGSFLGAFMAGSNLYVGLKTGWGLGVAITACILSFALGSALTSLRNAGSAPLRTALYALIVLLPTALAGFLTPSPLLIGAVLAGCAAAVWFVHRQFATNLSVLENNAMQSTASSAGYSTGGTMVSAQAALLLVQGQHIPWYLLMGWTFFMAVLGTVMAIPMKRQMINVEQLKFPSGIAAAETLRSLYSQGLDASRKARGLFIALGAGSVVAWLRDAHLTLADTAHATLGKRLLAWVTKASVIPGLIEIPGLTIRGVALKAWTISFEGSLILIAAGAFMGLRTTISMLGAALLNYGVVAPLAFDHGVISHDLGYRNIVSFSLWPGAALMVSSGLLSFGLQWRTVLRAFSGFGRSWRKDAERSGPDETARAELDAIEVPSSWFIGGSVFATLGLVVIGVAAFQIRWWLGIVAVLLAFVLAIVACRATGETDTTPVGAMGKITQLTYGILAPANVVTNLMTASITAGAAGSAADLLTDLKSGYLLGASPRRQFLAQLSGTVVGTLAIVPLFYWLVPTPDVIGSARFPAPAAQVWRGVAVVLANGIESLHPWARWGMLVGAAIGVVLPLLELAFPKHKHWVPSAMGVGLALVIPCFNSISMFLGALIAWAFSQLNREAAERYTIPCASGLIAGESLLGVAIALLAVAGYLD
ncbi:MAG: OPT family oligopeptide transporter [Deltaproteobacteria bacterium]